MGTAIFAKLETGQGFRTGVLIEIIAGVKLFIDGKASAFWNSRAGRALAIRGAACATGRFLAELGRRTREGRRGRKNENQVLFKLHQEILLKRERWKVCFEPNHQVWDHFFPKILRSPILLQVTVISCLELLPQIVIISL